jgi:hypothetical protein
VQNLQRSSRQYKEAVFQMVEGVGGRMIQVKEEEFNMKKQIEKFDKMNDKLDKQQPDP